MQHHCKHLFILDTCDIVFKIPLPKFLRLHISTMMNLKEISKKIIKGDFSSLLGFGNGNKNLHPTEVAQMLGYVPADTALQAFGSLPTTTQSKIFPYLGILLQRKIIQKITKVRVTVIFNELSLDDRVAFYSSLKGVERSTSLESY